MNHLYHSRAKFGVSKATKVVIELLLETIPGFYIVWMKTSPRHRATIERRIREALRHELLGEEFLQCLADDALKDNTIHVESAVFQYLKKKMYHGDTRALLMHLQSIKGHQ